jgi:hypothetical protein
MSTSQPEDATRRSRDADPTPMLDADDTEGHLSGALHPLGDPTEDDTEGHRLARGPIVTDDTVGSRPVPRGIDPEDPRQYLTAH